MASRDSPVAPSPAYAPDVADILATGLGLTTGEFRAYEFLAHQEAATASQVARVAKQSRGRIYETLRKLVEKGLVREEPSRPIRYTAVPLTEILSVSLAETLHRAELLEKLFQDVKATSAAQAKAGAKPVRPGDFSVVTGRKAVLSEARRMLLAAQEYFWLAGSAQLAERVAATPTLLRALGDAARRGINVRIYCATAPGMMVAHQAIVARLGQKALHVMPAGAAPVLTHFLTETEGLAVITQPDDASPERGEDVGIRVGHASWSEDARRRLESSQPTTAILPGPNGPGAREDKDPALAFLEALGSANREVLALGSFGWQDLLERGWQSTLGVYAQAKARGVAFRALAQEVASQSASIEPFRSIWEIRSHPRVRTTVFICDRKELFLAFLNAEGHDIRFTRVSRDAREVAHYVALFDEMWSEAKAMETSKASAAALAPNPQEPDA